ncbi:CLUMA_CG013831, isoform A [Clunio marinus]|uniref:CLUMA_CG013831, isoform A n=1 Tax=Clunio marinus TaxID=568069 RepID=A0A1J1IK12_9DIPT|nr:CLUMA_CG013831, isoform A [Clunio marinus]
MNFQYHHCLYIFFLIFSWENFSEACDGYDIKLKNIKNCCPENQVVTIMKNSTTVVNEKCEVSSYTCADVKAYTRTTVIVELRRNGITIYNGTQNLCQKSKKNELSRVIMSVFGLRCSMEQKIFCDNGKKLLTLTSNI